MSENRQKLIPEVDPSRLERLQEGKPEKPVFPSNTLRKDLDFSPNPHITILIITIFFITIKCC